MSSKLAGVAGLSRRQYLAAGTAAATAAVAGCTEGVVNWFADQFLEDVNVFNETDSSVTGTITVTAPGGETRLDEEFTLTAAEGNTASESEEDSANLEVYEEVWTDAGAYDVSIDLENPIDGETSASDTVSIEAPDDEMLVVILGGENLDVPIAFRVGESLSDTWPEAEE